MTFWEHLDELRDSLIKMIVAVLLFSIAAFCMKDALFDIILAPTQNDFITYRLLHKLSAFFNGGLTEALQMRLINTGLAQQFLLHVKASCYAGILVASPYLIYCLFHFIAPALYRHERRYASYFIVSGYVMFLMGVLLSYLLIFPLTFRFLGSYQVSSIVENTVTISSYIDTLMSISLAMGIVFEIPVVCWLLAKMGWLHRDTMKKYSRHIVVAVLITAAVITPTSDVFTLLLVALPMWLLYRFSIFIVKKSERS